MNNETHTPEVLEIVERMRIANMALETFVLNALEVARQRDELAEALRTALDIAPADMLKTVWGTYARAALAKLK